MAQDIVSGLFGPQPWQIQQARQDAIAQAADRFAAQSPFERAAGLGYRAGAGLGQIAGGMLGLEDPAIVEAQQRRAAMEGLDITSPEALLQRAQQVQDPQLRMRLMMAAQEQSAKQQDLALKRAQELAQLRKAQSEGSPLAKIDPSKYTQESIQKWVAGGMRDPSVLVSVEKQATPSEYARMLVESGLDPNSMEFKAAMRKYAEAKLTGTAKGAGTTLVMPGQEKMVDIPKFRKDVQDTIKSQLTTIEASDKTLAALWESIATDNPVAFQAARTQLAKAAGDSQISLREIEAAGGDPSIYGKIIDTASVLFTGTPSIDTQYNMQRTIHAIRKVAASKANSELAVQRRIAKASGYTDEQIETALSFDVLKPRTPETSAKKAGGQVKTLKSGVTVKVERTGE